MERTKEAVSEVEREVLPGYSSALGCPGSPVGLEGRPRFGALKLPLIGRPLVESWR